jgi:hypothetical protein
MRQIARFTLLASGFGLAAAAAACSSARQGPQPISPDSSSAPPGAISAPTSPTPVAVSPAAASPQAQAALAAYRAMIADWVSAAATSNYQDPALAHHASGSALSYMTHTLYIQQQQKSVGKGEPQLLGISFGQVVPASNPTEVEINSCLDDSTWLQYTTDGHLYNNIPGGRHRTQVLVVLTNTWKVDQFAFNKVGTC